MFCVGGLPRREHSPGAQPDLDPTCRAGGRPPAWDAYTVWTGPTAVGQRLFLIRVAISLGFVIPLSYGFWLIGGFGGADAKAFMLIAVLVPSIR